MDENSGLMRCESSGCQAPLPATGYFAHVIGLLPDQLVTHIRQNLPHCLAQNHNSGKSTEPGFNRFQPHWSPPVPAANPRPNQTNDVSQTQNPQNATDLVRKIEQQQAMIARLNEQVRALQQGQTSPLQTQRNGKREQHQANSRWAVTEAMKRFRDYHITNDFAFLDENINWKGTFGTLLSHLNHIVPIEIRASDEWPSQANVLSRRVGELATCLKQHGVHVNFQPNLPDDRKYKRWIEIHVV